MTIRILLAVAAVAACLTSQANAQWYAGFDAMAVTRSSPASPVFQRNQVQVPAMGMGGMATTAVGTQTILSGNDLDLDFTTAGRLTVGNRSGVFGVEGSYMLTDKWTESASAFDSSGMLASPFTAVGVTPDVMFDNNTAAMVNYSTEMQSAELNLTQRVYSGWNGDASVLYGVKSVWIDETLSYMTTNAMTTNTQHVAVDNFLIGPQLGVLCESPFPGGKLDLAFKIALTNHSANETALLNGVPATGSESGASFVSDIGINGTFFITPNLNLRAGYHVLSITDAALATDNLENLAAPNFGIVDVRSDRGVVYQSLYLGLMLTR